MSAAHAALVEALKLAEWGEYQNPDWGCQTFCPVCHNERKHGHTEGCQLAAALALAGAAPEQPAPVAVAQDFAPGWRWMTNPTRNNGEPMPVFCTEDAQGQWYEPLEITGRHGQYWWDERSKDWCTVAAPTPGAQESGATPQGEEPVAAVSGSVPNF